MVLDTPQKIEAFRLRSLRQGLKLEIKGMRLTAKGKTSMQFLRVWVTKVRSNRCLMLSLSTVKMHWLKLLIPERKQHVSRQTNPNVWL